MAWSETSPPASLAVPVSDLSDHLRLSSSDQDRLLEFYLMAAASVIERKTRRLMIERTVRYEADSFCNTIELPVAPVTSVQSVEYYDSSGTLSTLSTSDYQADLTRLLATVSPRPLGQFPATQSGRTGAVRVNFTAGYGPTPDDVPAGLRMAVLFLAAHYHINRAPVDSSTMLGEVPLTLKYAVDAYAIPSL